MPTRVPPVSSAVKRKGLFDRNKTEKRCLNFRLAKNQYQSLLQFKYLKNCNNAISWRESSSETSFVFFQHCAQFLAESITNGNLFPLLQCKK